ncbi:unnamed protein product [Caenorhabditis brenneri]
MIRRSRVHRSCKAIPSHSSWIKKGRKSAIVKLSEKMKKEMRDLMNMDPKQLSTQKRNKLAQLIVKRGIAQLQSVCRNKAKGSRSNSSDGSTVGKENNRKKYKRAVKTQAVQPATTKNIQQPQEKMGPVISENEVRKNLKSVTWDENEKNITAEYKIQMIINRDPQLNGLYSRDVEPMINRENMKKLVHIRFSHLNRESGPLDRVDIPFTDELVKSINNAKYIPPVKRILMIGEKSDSWRTDTLVFSDIKNETVRNIVIPKTFKYQYSNKNVFNEKKYPALAKFTKEAEKPENIIKCDCCEGGLMKRCWENKDCPCYQANKKLKNILQNKKEKETNFSTFDPIMLKAHDNYFEAVGFACSEACACRGNCTNNSTFLTQKEIAQLEVFRKDKDMGFGIRTNTLIPAGTPLLEFTGEIYGDDLPEADSDYAYAITWADDNFHQQVFENSKAFGYKNFSNSFMENLKEQWNKTWYINPKKIGNIARTVCHSCEPNSAIVRLFQRGFSPSHCRIILVTQEVVFPGDEISFDYGPAYVDQILKKNCLCKRQTCANSKDFSEFAKASLSSLEEYESLKYHFKFMEYKKNVLDPIQTRFPNL